MATKLRKIDNTFVTANEILTLLNNAGGVTYANPGGGTENIIQIPDANGELQNTFVEILNDSNYLDMSDPERTYIGVSQLWPQVHRIGSINAYWERWDDSNQPFAYVSHEFRCQLGVQLNTPYFYIYDDESEYQYIQLRTNELWLGRGDGNINLTDQVCEINVPVVIDNLTPNYIPTVNTNGQLVDSSFLIETTNFTTLFGDYAFGRYTAGYAEYCFFGNESGHLRFINGNQFVQGFDGVNVSLAAGIDNWNEYGGVYLNIATGNSWLDLEAPLVQVASPQFEIYPDQSYSTVTAQFDNDAGANESALSLKINGALKRVIVGAADSAGTGYRTLRITN